MTRMPQITPGELVAFLRKQGFADDRQSGSHLTLRKKQLSVTVPIHRGSDLGRGLAARILRDAGYSVDDFLRLR
jgi:predicted RNA binding protein YcfA (HicA-like mRNA interferase family)